MTAPIIIAATVTPRELAEAIGRAAEEVGFELESRGEPHGPDDPIPSDLAVDVARSLGARVSVEPRDHALEFLYARETMGEPTMPEGRAGAIVEGVLAALDGLDERIEEVSEHWSVSRMPVVDRNVLRIALHELEQEPDLPTSVIISEAVRLAGTYSTERSASFVNGVLASLARDARQQ